MHQYLITATKLKISWITDAFERVQERAEDGKDALMDTIDEIKG
ncbi:hypothetical protein O9992_02125 [Vibrio lentus]|nr:hypothetical protein [Vibrio lentus]